MRRTLTFTCEGAVLTATLDEAQGAAGLLIVSGGNEIRCGAHRGMAELAAAIAQRGYPVFRFDRRGIGDSEGINGGFLSSGPDIAAALAAFRDHCSRLTRVVGFGNCDAASALVLHDAKVDARVLANPWVIEPTDDLPPPAAIRERYAQRLRDPRAWTALLRGRIDVIALGRGLVRLARPGAAAPDSLSVRVMTKLAAGDVNTVILLATGDGTAIAFKDQWTRGTVKGVEILYVDSASHSFAEDLAFAQLVDALLGRLDGNP